MTDFPILNIFIRAYFSLLLFLGIQKDKFICHICGYKDKDQGIGGWGVTTKLWLAHGNKKGMMCMNCFEKKLGRKLEAKDFCATFDNHSHKKVQQIFKNEGYSEKAGWTTVITFSDKWVD